MIIPLNNTFILIFSICILYIPSTLHAAHKTDDQIPPFQHQFDTLTDQEKMYVFYDSAEAYRYLDPEVALYYITSGIKLAEQEGDKNLQADFWNSKGLLWYSKFDYDKAMKSFMTAISIYKETDDFSGIGYAYLNLGASNNVDSLQYKYYLLALDYFLQEGNDLGIGRTYNNLGVVQMDHYHQTDSARHYFEMALEEFTKINNEEGIAAINTNIGELYMLERDFDQALIYLNSSIAQFRFVKNEKGVAHALSNIGNVYLQLMNYEYSLLYLDSAERIAKKISFDEKLAEIYQYRSTIHDSLADFKSALYWARLNKSKQGEVNDQRNQDKVLALQKEFEVSENLREIEILEKSKRTSRIIQAGLVLIFILLVWISITIYRKQKDKVKKMHIIQNQIERINKTEKELMAADIKNKEIEKQLLEKEVELQSKKISGLASSVVRKNDFMDDLKTEISGLKGIDSDVELKDVANKLLISLHQNLEVNSDQEELKMQVERKNQNFFSFLEINYPLLSKGERQILGYLRHKIPTKTISSILTISESSVYTKRYRLRRKLGLKKEDSLSEFLNKLPF